MLAEAQMRGYGGAGPAGQEGLLRVVLPRCEPGQGFDACQPDLTIGTAGVALGVVAFIGVAGGACFFVLSGQWSLMLMKLEQTIRS